MDGIRRTFSFRKKKKSELIDGSKPQEWLRDESKIKEGSCSFPVKYLGSIEVYESRGMQVCEEAIKALRKSKRKPQKATLYVSGDALRVSDDVRQHLLVDQTIEKVSFCAPDRGYERGFAYICRDGATRRWMCHAFLAVKDSGERLSHAVGCAFAICLEKKQKRERDACQLTATEDRNFTRTGSYRPATLAERLIDPQSAISPNQLLSERKNAPVATRSPGASTLSVGAIPRPRPNPFIMNRPGSLRLFPKFHNSSPFKRDMSLRLEDLPSNRQLFPRSLNGGIIQEEVGLDLDEQPPISQPKQIDSPMMEQGIASNSTVQPESPPQPFGDVSSSVPSYQTLPISAANSLIPAASSILPLVPVPNDPFSAAPINPQTIQQHQKYFTNIPENTDFPPQLDAFNRLSLSPSNPPTDLTTHCTVSSTPHLPSTTESCLIAPTSPFLGGPPIAAPHVPAAPANLVGLPWQLTTSPQLSHQFTQYLYEQPAQSIISDVNKTVAVRPRPSFPTSLLSNSWTTPTSSSFSSNWPDPVQSLLPPEPDRFADPFDVAWADRASGNTVLPTNGSISHKPGNPFTNIHPPVSDVYSNGITATQP